MSHHIGKMSCYGRTIISSTVQQCQSIAKFILSSVSNHLHFVHRWVPAFRSVIRKREAGLSRMHVE